jgi:hypothetical protein
LKKRWAFSFCIFVFDLGDGATADGTLRLLLGAERSEASGAVDVSASGYLDGLASDHIKADGAVELLAKGNRHIVELLGDMGRNVGGSGCLAIAGRTGNWKETDDTNRLVRTAGHRLIILCPRIGLRTTARGMDIVGLGHLEGKGLEGIRKGGLTSIIWLNGYQFFPTTPHLWVKAITKIYPPSKNAYRHIALSSFPFSISIQCDTDWLNDP